MKSLLIAALAAASLSLTAFQASAASCSSTVEYCTPYRVSTLVVHRCSYCKTAYDHCGNAYHYTLTVVTFRDIFSDGSSQTYNRSFRS